MTSQKTQKTRGSKPVASPAGVSYDSIASAAAGMGLTKKELQKAKAAGCPAFRGSRVYHGELLRWLEEHKDELSKITGKDEADLEKRLQEIRKLRLANDEKEGRLVQRAWVAERVQRAAGDLNAFRAKSESEHPKRFAAAADDVAKCRTIVKGIWDEVFAAVQSMQKHFQETP